MEVILPEQKLHKAIELVQKHLEANKKILDKLDKYLTIQLSRSAGALAACGSEKIAKENQ